MTKPPLPEVRKAAWIHPYKFSGVCSGRAWGMMLAVALGGGILIGSAGYWGGWLAYWVGYGGLDAAGWLAGTGMVGSGVGFALALLVFLFVGAGYPVILGSLAGAAVLWAAQRTKCRRIGAAVVCGLLAGIVAWATLALTGLLLHGRIRESSRILDNIDDIDNVPDWLVFAIVAIDALLVVGMAVYAARTLKDTPYCEACRKWYRVSKKATMPMEFATLLIDALASGSVVALGSVPAAAPAAAPGAPSPVGPMNRIELLLQRCDCDESSAMLTADAKWSKATGKGAKKMSGRWFRTTITPQLARDIEKALFPK